MSDLPAQLPPNLMLLAAAAGGWLLLTNILAFAAFAVDKRRALEGEGRLPETTLLLLATIGGWIGAKLAQIILRHKSSKQPFGLLLNASGLLLPMVLGLPFLINAAPDLAGRGYAALSSLNTGASGTTGPEATALPKRIGPGGDKASHKTVKVKTSD